MMSPSDLELTERVGFEGKLDWDSDDSDDHLLNDDAGSGGRGETRNGGFVLPPPVQGKHQLPAMLKRQWLFKVKNIIQFDLG